MTMSDCGDLSGQAFQSSVCNIMSLKLETLQRHISNSEKCQLGQIIQRCKNKRKQYQMKTKQAVSKEIACLPESPIPLKIHIPKLSGDHERMSGMKGMEVRSDRVFVYKNYPDGNLFVTWLRDNLVINSSLRFQVKMMNILQAGGAKKSCFTNIMKAVSEHFLVNPKSLLMSESSIHNSLWKIFSPGKIKETALNFMVDQSKGVLYSFDAVDVIKNLLLHPILQDFEKILVGSKSKPFTPYVNDGQYIQHILDGDVWKRAVAKYSSSDTFLLPICLYSDSAQVSTNGSIGDSVNVASRIEGLTKQYGLDNLVAAETLEGTTEFATLEVDRVGVVGRSEPLTVHTILDTLSNVDSEDFAKLKEEHETMLECYRSGDVEEALVAMSRAQRLAGPELLGLYALYANRLSSMRETGVEPGWDGVFRSTKK